MKKKIAIIAVLLAQIVACNCNSVIAQAEDDVMITTTSYTETSENAEEKYLSMLDNALERRKKSGNSSNISIGGIKRQEGINPMSLWVNAEKKLAKLGEPHICRIKFLNEHYIQLDVIFTK